MFCFHSSETRLFSSRLQLHWYYEANSERHKLSKLDKKQRRAKVSKIEVFMNWDVDRVHSPVKNIIQYLFVPVDDFHLPPLHRNNFPRNLNHSLGTSFKRN